jgi:hypothetical protein
MIQFSQALTLWNDNSTLFTIVKDSFVYELGKHLIFEYFYNTNPNNTGCVHCRFKDGIYSGSYREFVDNEYHNGSILYIVTEDADRFYIHGEWHLVPSYTGYDFIIGRAGAI